MSLGYELINSLQDPRMLHAATVHVPIALALLAAPLAIALALTKGRNRTLLWCTLVAYLVIAAAGVVAMKSGEASKTELGAAPAAVRALISQHEQMGEKVWIFGVATSVFVAGAFLSNVWARRVCLALCVAGACVTAGWVGVLGHFGGEAVYSYGAGTPSPLTEADLARRGAPPEAEPVASDPRAVQFRRDVRPVLERSCMGCHGSDEDPEGGLDLTSMRGILAGGKHGPALIPGQADASLLYRAVSWTHETLRMPPKKVQLPPDVIKAIHQWIEEGAVWTDE